MGLFTRFGSPSGRVDAPVGATARLPVQRGEWLAMRVPGGKGRVPANCTGLSLCSRNVRSEPAGPDMKVRPEGKLWWLNDRPLTLRLAPAPEAPEAGVQLDLAWHENGQPFDLDALAARLDNLDCEVVQAPHLEAVLRQTHVWPLLALPPCVQADELDAARHELNAVILHTLGLKCLALFRVDLAAQAAAPVETPEDVRVLDDYLADIHRNDAHAEARCFIELPRLRDHIRQARPADASLDASLTLRLEKIRNRLSRLVSTRTGRWTRLPQAGTGRDIPLTVVRDRARASLRVADSLDAVWLALHGAERDPDGAINAWRLGEIETAIGELSDALDERFTPWWEDVRPKRRLAPRHATATATAAPRMAALPPPCEAFAMLPDGGRLTVRATGSADLSCDMKLVGGSTAAIRTLHQSMKAAMQAARAVEPSFGANFGVVLELEQAGGSGDKEAMVKAVVDAVAPVLAVVADRALRGLWPAPVTLVLGTAGGDWGDGAFAGLPDAELQRRCLEAIACTEELGPIRLVWPPAADDAERDLRTRVCKQQANVDCRQVDRLAGLMEAGGIEPGSMPRVATVHFPLVGDTLGSIEPLTVKLLPADADSYEIAGSVPNSDRDAVVALLAALRTHDNTGGKRWRTVVAFPAKQTIGRSFELALLVADRIARGREFGRPAGRLIATGAVSFPNAAGETWINPGAVSLPEDQHLDQKGQLLQAQAKAGDRVLVPANWRLRFATYEQALKSKANANGVGVKVVYVDRLLPAA